MKRSVCSTAAICLNPIFRKHLKCYSVFKVIITYGFRGVFLEDVFVICAWCSYRLVNHPNVSSKLEIKC